ncbi:hypothetical protein C9374_008168 [Naegleria lovaniensis]|uniref:ENPP1-3/EXOG-like endonuclease/phosphodiesterase domain-containing protein n=1 Tax=Naegleria lovaniensis TaxID=51637 RepID=A0AA88GJ99_NAELO|nr:uncharacterized protein C9374_008168 [Naegleria lovaniensis]KAG2378529.1 hypothetical protein C9374_008168 [Naegleria lovaniensis]
MSPCHHSKLASLLTLVLLVAVLHLTRVASQPVIPTEPTEVDTAKPDTLPPFIRPYAAQLNQLFTSYCSKASNQYLYNVKNLYLSCFDYSDDMNTVMYTVNSLSSVNLNKPNDDRPAVTDWYTFNGIKKTIPGTSFKPYGLFSYDRGHLVANNDFRSAEDKKYTFIVINKAAQNSNVNRGIWRHVEHSLRNAIMDVAAAKKKTIEAIVVTRPLYDKTNNALSTTNKDVVSPPNVQIPMSFNKFVMVIYDGGIKEVFCLQVTNRDNVDYKTDKQRLEIASSVTKDYANCAAGLKDGISLGSGPFATGDVYNQVVEQMKKFTSGWVNPCGFGKVDPVEFILEKNSLTTSEWRLNIMNFKPCSNSAKCHPRVKSMTYKQNNHASLKGKEMQHTDDAIRNKIISILDNKVTAGDVLRMFRETDDSSFVSRLNPSSRYQGTIQYFCEYRKNAQFVPPKYVYSKTVQGKKDPERQVTFVGVKKARPVYSNVNKGKKSKQQQQQEPDPSPTPSTPPSSPGPKNAVASPPSPAKNNSPAKNILPATKVGGMRVTSPRKGKKV